MIIFIVNNFAFHYEIIPSIIEKYNLIINHDKSNDIEIYLKFNKNDIFKKYITEQYPKCKYETPQKYDFYINCTIYLNDISNIINDGKHFYISHEYIKDSPPNVFYLTPLCSKNYIICDYMPFRNQKLNNLSIPIYVIQGNITKSRRNYNLLLKILENKYNYEYKIKIIGKGKLDSCFDKFNNQLIYKYDLNFTDYHKEFLDCYGIIPLITKESHPQYYKNKLTSTINYGLGYNLKFIIDADLQSIYKLDNVEIFNDINDISKVFNKSLEKFYNKT